MKIVSEAFGLKTAKASSAVKERIGAIRRRNPDVTCQSAVWAERRARLFGAVV